MPELPGNLKVLRSAETRHTRVAPPASRLIPYGTRQADLLADSDQGLESGRMGLPSTTLPTGTNMTVRSDSGRFKAASSARLRGLRNRAGLNSSCPSWASLRMPARKSESEPMECGLWTSGASLRTLARHARLGFRFHFIALKQSCLRQTTEGPHESPSGRSEN